jgi:hypothetical protein
VAILWSFGDAVRRLGVTGGHGLPVLLIARSDSERSRGERHTPHGKRNIPRDNARAMSAENVEIVQGEFEATSRRDADAFIALYHPEINMDTPSRIWAG